MNFPTTYTDILNRIDSVEPIAYGKTRNFIDGNVSYLSPYISRGVISTKQVMDTVLAKGYKPYEIKSFLQELAWRDYFQRVWQENDDLTSKDLKQAQSNVANYAIPSALIDTNTNINAIDDAINGLYETGYMHNHMRMYTASLACNIAQSHWKNPSQWMYYHLLDGDLASNACSWQWVAGAFSNKKYYANQENINRYTYSLQKDTFLDTDYESLATMSIPTELSAVHLPELRTFLPQNTCLEIKKTLPIHLYNHYQLDPLWRKDESANRILLLEPSHFEKFPISTKVLDFVLSLANTIDGIQIYVGEFADIKSLAPTSSIIYKEHPAFKHYQGIEDQRDWMFPQIKGYFPSFFKYWKACEKEIK